MGVVYAMENATDLASELTSNVGASNIVGAISPYIPWIAGLLVFFLGFYLVRRAMKGASKGKFRI